MRKSTAPCCDCKLDKRAKNSSYCAPCRNKRYVARYELTRNQKRAAARKPRTETNACNCGNTACNGLNCERATA